MVATHLEGYDVITGQKFLLSHNGYFEASNDYILRVAINRRPRVEKRQESHLLYFAIIVSVFSTFLIHSSYLLAITFLGLCELKSSISCVDFATSNVVCLR